jgi:hypothetical protein
MKGGAVIDERSPLNEAIDLRNEVHDPLDWGGTAEASFLVVVVSQLPPLALFNLLLEAIANGIQQVYMSESE